MNGKRKASHDRHRQVPRRGGNMTHADLVSRAKRWLRRRYPIVVSEVTTFAVEIPDAIAFSSSRHSCLVECKASREDFLADARKPFRRRPETGLGRLRYYMTPPGLVAVEDLPERWGLLWCHARTVQVLREAEHIPGERVSEQETLFLLSLLRRVQVVVPGGLDAVLEQYSAPLRERAREARERDKRSAVERAHRAEYIKLIGSIDDLKPIPKAAGGGR